MKEKSFLRKMKPISIGASMADLAMLLLIFFMTATSTEPPQGAEVELPKAKTEGAEQDSLYVTLSKDNRLYFDGRVVNNDEFQDLLQIRKSERDRVVAVTADKNLRYEDVNRLLKVLQQNDFLNVVFMSESKEGASK
jgi:biopolymer transport protein TolR